MTCTVCIHPEAREINSDLVQGIALRNIALRTGLGHSSLFRHGKSCIAARLRQAKRKQNMRASQSLQDQLDELREYVEAIMATTEDEDIKLKAVDKRHKQIELHAKLAGEFKSEQHVISEADRNARILEILEAAKQKMLLVALSTEEVQ